MFAIFSLRRPDILPVGTYPLVYIVYTSELFCVSGDVGVQRGLVRWFLSLYSPTHLFALSPEKVSGQGKSLEATLNLSASENDDALPEVVDAAYKSKAVEDVATGGRTPISKDEDVDLPPPFTPSIHKTLNHSVAMEPLVLPEGITVAMLKSRLEGKKKIKYVADPLDMGVLTLLVRGAFLTPQEMAALTECWKPYRSLGVFPKDLTRMFSCQALGVYYMWSLAAAPE